MLHLNLSNEPNFEALSYTWGSTDYTRQIHIDGGSFPVGEKLFSALLHLRLEDEERILWVNAICINQLDDIERNHQVDQMSQIYGLANRTIVWLDDDAFLIWWLFLPKSQRAVSTSGSDLEELARKRYWRRLWSIQEFLLSKDLIIQCAFHSIT